MLMQIKPKSVNKNLTNEWLMVKKKIKN